MNTNQILLPYFQWLETKFGSLAREATRNGLSASDIARHSLSVPGKRETFRADVMPLVCNFIKNFWKVNENDVKDEIQRLPGLRARFGGDLGPQVEDKIFEKAGLYFDTILVPDPLLRIANISDQHSKTKDYYVLKYAVSSLLMKDAFLSNVHPPIAVLYPERSLDKEESQAKLANLARLDCIALVNKMYGTAFDTYEEVENLFSKFNSVDEAAKEIVTPELLFLDERAERTVEAQVEAYKKRAAIDWDFRHIEALKGGNMLLFEFFSRMMQVTDILNLSALDEAHPIVSAPVSFNWLSTKVRVNQELVAGELNAELLNLNKTNSLLAPSLDWMGNVTMDQLVELRKKGGLREIRELMNKDIDRLSKVSFDNAEKITSQIDYNLASAIEQHQAKFQDLNKAFRSELAVNGATFGVSALAVLQPTFATILPAWLPAVGGVAGIVKLKDLVANTNKYYRDKAILNRAPVGILWQAKQKAQ